MKKEDLIRFVTESNAIEGIHREPTERELEATLAFVELPVVLVKDLENLVNVCTNGARLRTRSDMNVRVGSHVAPRGGPHIKKALQALLDRADAGEESAYVIHVEYETLHPFQDGNGRSGRALWAWQMYDTVGSSGLSLGFLHAWYYQSLDHSRRKP